MNLLPIIFLVNLWPASAISIIIDIFKFKNIENGVIFYCKNNSDVVLMSKDLIANNIKISSLNTEAVFSQVPHLGHSKIGFVLDTSCQFWNETIGTFDESYFRSSCTWLINTDDLAATVDTLAMYPIEVNSDVIVISKTGEDNTYKLYEVYNKGFYTKGSFTIAYLGSWDSKLYLRDSKRNNLTGVVLKCVVVVVDPIVNQTFEHYLEHTKPGPFLVDSLHKLKFYTLVKYLGNIFNFTYDLRRTNSWGYLRNGSFDGMVGSLQHREADIGGTPIFYRPDRAQFIDYITPTWQSRPCFILRHPKYPGGFYTIYTRPLTDIVWYCIIAIFTAIGATLCVMLKLKPLREPGDDQDCSSSMAFIFIFSAVSQQDDQRISSFRISLVLTLSIAFYSACSSMLSGILAFSISEIYFHVMVNSGEMKSTTLTRGSLSMKIIFFITFVFSLTLYQYYNATVVSTLLREPPKSIRNLKDLLNSNLKAGVEDVLYNKDYFKRTTDPVAIELYHQKIVTSRHYNFFPPDQGMKLVKEGGFAFHVDSVTAYRIMKRSFSERELCDAHEIQLYPPQTMAAALTKHSPYREHVAIGIRKIYEAGLMHRLKSVWDEPKPPCVHTPDTSIFSVTLREFSSALILLAFGIALAVLILGGEILLEKYKNTPYEFRH